MEWFFLPFFAACDYVDHVLQHPNTLCSTPPFQYGNPRQQTYFKKHKTTLWLAPCPSIFCQSV